MTHDADGPSVASVGSHGVAPLKKTLHCRCPACGFCPTIQRPYGRWVSMHDRQPVRLEMVVAWSPILQDAGLAWIDNGGDWEWAWQSAHPLAGKRRGGTPSHWMEFLEVPHPPNQDATPSVQGGSVTVTMDNALTPVDRLAIEWAAAIARKDSQIAVHKTLCRLLKRLA